MLANKYSANDIQITPGYIRFFFLHFAFFFDRFNHQGRVQKALVWHLDLMTGLVKAKCTLIEKIPITF